MAESGEAAADVLLSIVNSASSSIFEGIGDSGITMLDWMESDDDRVQALMNVYRAGIGTGGGVAVPRARLAGAEGGGLAAPSEASWAATGWVANRVKFIQSPSRAVLIWSYWWGERVVTKAWNRIGVYRRDRVPPLPLRPHALERLDRAVRMIRRGRRAFALVAAVVVAANLAACSHRSRLRRRRATAAGSCASPTTARSTC